jgi:hypothetical protein
LLAVKRDLGGSGDDEPMFRAPCMFLVTKAFPGKNFDSLYFIAVSLVKNGKISPRAVFRFPGLIYPIHNL